MISGEIGVNQLIQIRLMLEGGKFRENTLNIFEISIEYESL